MDQETVEAGVALERMEQALYGLRKASLAMAYVPYQKLDKLYDMNAGLKRGTLFPELDLPFIGEEAVPHG
jgi:hypothetical protein